ncbi:hypothetical protein MetMK1DRAFT_00012300 [Metallosphaera yellowstonensis MK1]|uniref:Transposase n=1 Tax=Metallosphaera yellowstonensis MK1 TaxID=671065 RepID=H2C3A6_9CREN|nr:hypothetical protein MetMK1DRAFT_00012300 [Metallosphaera yellowstonensis MK1]
MPRKLRRRSFTPKEEYVYLTHSIKNDKEEESRVLLENYKVLLQDALDRLWDGVQVKRKEG